MRLSSFKGLLLILSLTIPALGAEVLWQPGDAPGTILVSFRPAPSRDEQRAEARRLGLDENSSAVKLRGALHQGVSGTVDLDVPLLDLQRVRIPGPSAAAVNAAMRSYRSSGLVLAAEPDHPIRAAAVNLNDPLYAGGQQWYLTSTAWPAAVAAFNAGSFSLVAPVTVAVIDTGVDQHADLGPLLTGANYVSGELADDENGHGTFCAGLIAATTGNSTGMTGAFFVPNLVRILPVKVLNTCGSGNTSDLAAGIAYAVAQGARVINLSIQSTQGSQAMENAVDQARLNGVMIVAAAGNDFGGPTSYPAVYTQVVAVGALDHNNGRATYSNFGKLDLSAPGGDLACPSAGCTTSPSGCPFEIWSLAADHPACLNPANSSCVGLNKYESGAGTSFAAPLVVAAAALLFSQDPSRHVEDVLRILLQSALPTALGPGYHSETGWGKVNYYGALTYQPSNQPSATMKAYNWPNPFNPDKDGVTTLTFFLPDAAATKVRLLDAGGDLVRQWELDATKAGAGMNLIAWDGRNGAGAMVANGPYTMVVESGSKRAKAVVAVLR